MTDAASQPNFYWMKVWGRPGGPSTEALLFNSRGRHDGALKLVRPGDIVVYLTSDGTDADPMARGHVSGAVEIAGDQVMAEELDIPGRARPVDFRENGSFRWPYGITVRRTWRVIDKESNDFMIPGHRALGIQGAATIHEMRPDEVSRFVSLRVEEQTEDGNLPIQEVFSVSLRRPWRQKAGRRAAAAVDLGCDLYVAWIIDAHGATFKIGSGKHKDRIEALNYGRHPSQGEICWSVANGFLHTFLSADAARDAEDQLLSRAKAERFGSSDHGEFLKNISLDRLRRLFAEAVLTGLERDARTVEEDR